MKKINYIVKALLLCGVILFSSCERTTNLDLTDNVNNLQPDQVEPGLLLNKVQLNFAGLMESFGRTGGQLTRIDQMSGRTYLTAYGPSSFDGRWSTAYRGLLKDLKVMNTISEEKGYKNHIAIGKILEAYTMFTLVDYFGDVPYTEALEDLENLNPKADSGESIYAAGIILLNEAIAILENASDYENIASDFYYGHDYAKWIKVANTFKMKAYLTTRLVDPTAVQKFNDIIAGGKYISSTADDFEFTYGKNEIQPDTRHPRYSRDYTSTGGNSYRSNWFMAQMMGDWPTALRRLDPRLFYYFYRQSSTTPGNGSDPNQEKLSCSVETAPAHYAGYVFCNLPRGYWGRDHGNQRGIPPDGFDRTLEGVYPSGGTVDTFTYRSQRNGFGRGGNGITPIMLASWVDFMRAEISAFANNNMATAKSLLFRGMDKSIDKVMSFADNSIVTGARLKARFLRDMNSAWNATTTDDAKKEIISTQYFVALYGNGTEAYNFYRRTGFPKGLQPNIEANPGNFPRSMWYPANHANTNANVTQKPNLDVPVFWDNNPQGFLTAN